MYNPVPQAINGSGCILPATPGGGFMWDTSFITGPDQAEQLLLTLGETPLLATNLGWLGHVLHA